MAARDPPTRKGDAMRISMLTAGSRGDVQPIASLGLELARRGHEVRVAASPNTVRFVEDVGLPATPFGPDSDALVRREEFQRAIAAGRLRSYNKALLREMTDAWDGAVADLAGPVAEADLVVTAPLAADMASALTDLHGVPHHALHPFPILPNRTLAHPMLSARALPPALAYAGGRLFEELWWRALRTHVEASRAALGLPRAGGPLRRRWDGIAVQAVDPALVPGLDMGPRFPVTGALGPDAETRRRLGEVADPDLDRWLDAGEPPVYFGFGSMPVLDPAATVAVLSAAARSIGVRALVSAGWNDMSALEPDRDDVRLVGALDHSRVLPRCLAAVHHGGAGTTHASLRAGLPTVVCSVLADQPYWGAQLRRLGVGATLPYSRLGRERLTAALRRVLEPEVRRRARDLGDRMVPTETANRAAADAIEHATSS